MKKKPRLLILTGFILVLTGAALPFLMLFHVLESTLFLNLFAYALSTAGLLLGIVGPVTQFEVDLRKPPLHGDYDFRQQEHEIGI